MELNKRFEKIQKPPDLMIKVTKAVGKIRNRIDKNEVKEKAKHLFTRSRISGKGRNGMIPECENNYFQISLPYNRIRTRTIKNSCNN